VEAEKEMAMKHLNKTASPRRPDQNTIPRLLWGRSEEWAELTVIRHKKFGVWKDISWKEYGGKVKHVALGLIGLGLKRGDRVAIMSENTPEWLFSDAGILAAGGVSVGVYPTNSAKQVKYVMEDSGSSYFIAGDEEQLDKILEVREALLSLKKIIIVEQKGLRNFSDPEVITFEEFLELGEFMDHQNPTIFESLIEATKPEDLAILIYTSGTTGPPKGSMISHSNLFFTVEAWLKIDQAYMNDETLAFLPLSHILQRLFSLVFPLIAGSICSFSEGMDTFPQDIREISPTIFIAVPRIWEKFYSSIIFQVKESTAVEKFAFKWALVIGKMMAECRSTSKRASLCLRIAFKLAEWAALNNIRKFIGQNRNRYSVTGGAPISHDLLEFYKSLGIDIREGYGLTESTGAAIGHHPGDYKFGTVGRPLPGIQVKIDEDGEILIKSHSVFMGYFGDPERTKEAIVDGWLHTGDIGKIDEEGHVILLDRKKDIIITAGGKNITPSEIENQLKFSTYINDAVVIGDGRKYLTCLIMIDDENTMKYAQDNRIPFTTYASLTRAPEIIKLIQKEVDAVNKNLAGVETIKKFRLIDLQLTVDDDEVTPTGKLKRKFVSEKFKYFIEDMYRE
jgi:long-chain acyl-CoA synthetase